MEVVLEFLDCHHVNLLLLLAEAGLNLQMERNWNCLLLDYHFVDLLLEDSSSAGLFPRPLFPLAALLAGLFGYPPPDPLPPLLDWSGGSPPAGLGFAPKGVH